jgi:squalene synthase HpnC
MRASDAGSGKTHRDENFPVASLLIARDKRAPIRAFYAFVRTADDVADHESLSPEVKLALLDELAASLAGRTASEPAGMALREQLLARDLPLRHAYDLLAAFRQDVTQTRYPAWPDLLAYCALSAMPVGRFVLDVHGEDRGLWAASDALCAALQVINHLQDCGADYRRLGRVYLPEEDFRAEGVAPESLRESSASPELRRVIARNLARVEQLLDTAQPLAVNVANDALSGEIGAIAALARRHVKNLYRRDPLCEDLRLGAIAFFWQGLCGAVAVWRQRYYGRPVVAERGR